MNIDEMPAGQDLDILVAKKVFGYTPRDLGWGLFFERPGSDGIVNIDRDTYRSFSTDIAAAWEILNTLQSAYGISLVIMPNGLTECSIVRHNREFTAQALTAPLAICRAALKAVAKSDP